MSRAAAIALALCAALALALAACGGDDEDEGSVATEGDGNVERVVIEAEEGAFDGHAVYRAAAPGVVTVRSVFGQASGLEDVLGGGGGVGQGSGFVISDEGEIITNAHVVTNAQQAGAGDAPGDVAEAREVYVQFADRNQVAAEIVGVDLFADVALLRVEPDGLDLQPLTLGSEDDVGVGEEVAAIGSPFSRDQSLSVGIVSATDRSIEGLTRFQIDGALQTDASINPGNSGGPLLDGEANVVGINQQIATASGGNQGVGFAVPIDLAERSVEELREHGEVRYAFLGVSTQPVYPQLAERLGIDVDGGALVTDVVPGGPAEEAGLDAGGRTITFQGIPDIPVDGDVIVGIDGEEIHNASDLPEAVARLDPGQEVTLDVVRDGESAELEVTLGERPGG